MSMNNPVHLARLRHKAWQELHDDQCIIKYLKCQEKLEVYAARLEGLIPVFCACYDHLQQHSQQWFTIEQLANALNIPERKVQGVIEGMTELFLICWDAEDQHFKHR